MVKENNPADIAAKLADPELAQKEAERKVELAKRESQKKEQLKKQAQVKNKSYFDVKVTCMLPATITYRVLAEDAQQASTLIKNLQPNSVQYKLIGRKELEMKIYNAGTSMMRFMKKLIGS